MATRVLDCFPMQLAEQFVLPTLAREKADRGSPGGTRTQRGQSAALASVCLFSAHQRSGTPAQRPRSGGGRPGCRAPQSRQGQALPVADSTANVFRPPPNARHCPSLSK